ncbi:hypothetical protein P4603_10930 [Priestia aryabhattai]|uniref:hypothetical protein n=1 Tax=Priestia aryabhattai TaxID=412384 RepID=UPI002E1C77A8|nr:hypothetical protein [Priestia aryabhattai]
MFSIDVLEVTKYDLTKNNPSKLVEYLWSDISGTSMLFTLEKLTISITLTTTFEDVAPTLYIGLDNIYSKLLEMMIDRSKGNFRLVSNSNLVFKDFSFSSKIGEIGQGLTKIFVQEILEVPICLNFEDYAMRRGLNISKNMSKSDFIYIDIVRRQRGLIDSKGSFFHSHNENTNDLKGVTGKLKKGLSQCDAINGHLNSLSRKITIHKHGCSCIKFHDSDSKHNTKIIYVDPELEAEKISDEELLEDIKIYYSNLIYKITGEEFSFNEENMQSKCTIQNYSGYEIVTFKNLNNLTLQLLNNLAHRTNTKFGILLDIWKSLFNNDLNTLLKYIPLNEKKTEYNNDFEIFSDGSVLVYNR